MRDIILIGINHKTAPVELRECMAFSKDESSTALDGLRRISAIHEALLYSTCNRVELLMVTADRNHAIGAAKKFISDFNKIPSPSLKAASTSMRTTRPCAIFFAWRPVWTRWSWASPRSWVRSRRPTAVPPRPRAPESILNRLMHRAFFVAKRVRTETGIGDRAVSISYAAVELARKIFGSLEGKRVLLIGAGEMAELAVEHLIRNQVSETLVANRTFENGLELSVGSTAKPSASRKSRSTSGPLTSSSAPPAPPLRHHP